MPSVGMGNLHLASAREMRRETEADKQKRSAAYSRAVEFFDKALQLDPEECIALAGHRHRAWWRTRKDYKNALQIFIKVRDTIKDPHVLYQPCPHLCRASVVFSKAIESYEVALSKDGRGQRPGHPVVPWADLAEQRGERTAT